MISIFVIISFITVILLTLAKDSFLNREFHIYSLITKYPFLQRELIKDTYEDFR